MERVRPRALAQVFAIALVALAALAFWLGSFRFIAQHHSPTLSLVVHAAAVVIPLVLVVAYRLRSPSPPKR